MTEDDIIVRACRISPTTPVVEVYIPSDDGTFDWVPLLFEGDVTVVQICAQVRELGVE